MPEGLKGFQRGIKINLGIKRSDATKLKMAYKTEKEIIRARNLGRLNKGRPAWNKGKKGVYSEETLDRMSKNRKGLIAWNKGLKGTVKHTENYKKRMSDLMKKRWKEGKLKNENGVKSKRWIKDRSQLQRFSKQGERRTSVYSAWRREVWLRDNFKCRLMNRDCKGKIEAHHILGWSSHPELRFIINNGITLCHAHHPRKRAEEKRLAPFFMELVSVSKE